jgi:hypothetical protein
MAMYLEEKLAASLVPNKKVDGTMMTKLWSEQVLYYQFGHFVGRQMSSAAE